MTAFIYRESSSGEGVDRCGASTAFDLDAINSPSFRKVSKFSTVSSSSSTRIPKSVSKNATRRITPSESMRAARQDQLLAAKNRDCCLGTL